MTWRLTTDAERERFSIAHERGGLCAACGRVLGGDEPVYIEPVMIERKPLTAPGAWWSERPVRRDAPLGAECASPGFLARTEGRTPEWCANCERPVYYAKIRAGRRWALCSKRCSRRAVEPARPPRTEGTR